VLGGNADVISVGSMWGPTRADGRVVVQKAFCSKGRDGHLVVIKKGVDFFVGGPGGITARETKEVEREFDLRQKFIPELQGQSLSTVASPTIKCSLNVAMGRSAALTRWLWGGTR